MATHQIPVHVKGQTTCSHHKEKQLDFYCEQCQEPICTKCISSVHKSHPLCDLSEITPQKTQYIKNFIERTEKHDLVHIGTCIASTDTLLKDNDETFEKLSRQLNAQTERLKRDLDMLTAHTLSLYEKIKDENTELIQKYKQNLEMNNKKLKQLLQDCKEVLQRGSHIQIFNTSRDVDSPTSLPVKPSLGTASFSPNKSPKGHIELAFGEVTISGQGLATTSGQDHKTIPGQGHMTTLGQDHKTTLGQDQTTRDKNISVPTPDNQTAIPGEDHTARDENLSVPTPDNQRQPSTQQHPDDKGQETAMRLLPETKLVKEFYSPCYIYSSCFATDDHMWTCTGYTDTLTLLDMNGTVIRELQHKTVIHDISVSPTSRNLWVCDDDNNIMELVSGKLTHRFEMHMNVSSICITTDDQIIAVTDYYLLKYTTQGDQLHSSSIKDDRKNRCVIDSITECPVTQNVAVVIHGCKRFGCDGNKEIMIMNSDIQNVFTYTGEIPSKHKQQPGGYPFDPYCVLYDRKGNLVVGDCNNRMILLLNRWGMFLRIIHTEPTYKPTALCIDGRGLLYVSFWYKVKVLQYRSL